MADYKRGSQEEDDAQLLHNAKAFGGTIGWELLELIERLNNKSTAMLTLLERWVKEFPCPVGAGRGTSEFWNQHKVIGDTKTLLKEAKLDIRDAFRRLAKALDEVKA